MREVVSTTDRQAWRAAHRRLLTSSDAAAIYGASRWKTALAVQQEKLHVPDESGTVVEEEPDEHERLYWGRRLEPIVVAEYALRRPDQRTYNPDCLLELEGTILATTPDALVDTVAFKGIPSRVVEAKLDRWGNPSEWDEAQGGKIPDDYRLQGLHHATVCAVQWVDYPVLFGAHELGIFTLEVNAGERMTHRQFCEDWWLVHVTNREAVEPEAGDTQLVKSMFEFDADKAIELPPLAVQLYDELESIAREKKPLKAREDALKNQIRMWMAGAANGYLPDGSGRGWSEALIPTESCGYSRKSPNHEVKSGETRRLTMRKARK